MTESARDLNYRVKVSDESAQGFRSAERNADSFFERMAQRARGHQMEHRKSGELALERMLNSPGRLAEVGFDALGVGIPAMIMQVVGDKLRESTGRMVEVRDQLREGKISGMEAFDQTMGSMPLIGGVWGAGRNVHELMTSEKYERKIEEEKEKLDQQAIDGHVQFFEFLVKDRRRIQDAIYESHAAERIASAWAMPDVQGKLKLESDVEALNRKREKLFDDELSKLQGAPGYQKEKKALEEKIDLQDKEYKEALGRTASGKAVSPKDWEKTGFEGLPPSQYEQLASEKRDELNKTRDALREQEASAKRTAEENAGSMRDAIDAQIAAKRYDIARYEFQLEEHKKESLRKNRNDQLDDLARYNAKNLQMIGEGLAAERVMIAREYDKRREDYQHQLADDLKAHAGDEAYIAERNAQAETEALTLGMRERQDYGDAAYRDTIRKRSDQDALLSMFTGLMDRTANLPGGIETPEMRKAKYILQQKLYERQTIESLDDMVKRDASLKPQADRTRGTLAAYMKEALSDQSIGRATFGDEHPLQLPSYDQVPVGFQGLAENARADDFKSRNDQLLSVAQSHTPLFQQMVDNLMKMLAGQDTLIQLQQQIQNQLVQLPPAFGIGNN